MAEKEVTATGPNGEKIALRDGQWVAVDKPGALPGRPTAAAAEQDAMIRQGLKSMAGELIANVIGLPHAAGEVLADSAALLRTGAGAAKAAVTGEPLDLANRFAAARERERGTSYAGALTSLPEPSGADVLRTLGTEPPQSAIADTAGRTAADVASLMTLRPGARVRELLKTRVRGTRAEPALKSIMDTAAGKVMRGLGRSAEAGFEGAIVGALGDGDPAKTAAWSAGIQAGGSLALATKATLFKHPFASFGALWMGHEMWKSMAPGPQNALESKDQAINEMVAAGVLGAIAGAAGASRGIGTGKVRDFTNALSSISRNAIASVITQLQEGGERGPQYERVVGAIAQDPDYFGREARIRLERAARSEKAGALLSEIDRLMKSTRFRQKYEELAEQ